MDAAKFNTSFSLLWKSFHRHLKRKKLFCRWRNPLENTFCWINNDCMAQLVQLEVKIHLMVGWKHISSFYLCLCPIFRSFSQFRAVCPPNLDHRTSDLTVYFYLVFIVHLNLHCGFVVHLWATICPVVVCTSRFSLQCTVITHMVWFRALDNTVKVGVS